jgi:DNA-binding NarL/FixJ family response regulator
MMNDPITLPLTILVADDHRLFRQGLIGLMNTRPDLVYVVGEASTGREAVKLACETRPDIVLMDITMPDGNGLQATRTIYEQLPDTAVIMLTASDDDENLHEAVRLGASGYLLKSLDAAELFDLIAGVSRGEVAITRTMAARLLKGLAGNQEEPGEVGLLLTEREIDVLRLVAAGASNPAISDALYISVNTVKSHMRHILEKLQLENRTQAATYAVQSGLAPPPSSGHSV